MFTPAHDGQPSFLHPLFLLLASFMYSYSSVLQINWAMNNKQEFIDIVETVYRGARKGRGLVVSPKGKA